MPPHDDPYLAEWRMRCKHARHVRGFRIRTWYQGRPVGTDSPTLWATESAIPPEWEVTKNNPSVIRAILFRSGKKVDQFTRLSAQVTSGQRSR